MKTTNNTPTLTVVEKVRMKNEKIAKRNARNEARWAAGKGIVKANRTSSDDYSAIYAKVVDETEKAIKVQGHSERTMWIPKSVSRVCDAEMIEVKNWFRTANGIQMIF